MYDRAVAKLHLRWVSPEPGRLRRHVPRHGEALHDVGAVWRLHLNVGGTFYNHAFYDNHANVFAAVMVDKITLADAGTIRIRCGNGFGDPWTTISIVLTAQPITP
jgi:hypothetical protein